MNNKAILIHISSFLLISLVSFSQEKPKQIERKGDKELRREKHEQNDIKKEFKKDNAESKARTKTSKEKNKISKKEARFAKKQN